MKKVLVYLFLAIFVITMGGNSASAAETKTAKQVVKKALNTKIKDSDVLTIESEMDCLIDMAMDGNSANMNMAYDIDMQKIGKNILGKYVGDISSNGMNETIKSFMEYDSKKDETYTYTYNSLDDTYLKSKEELESDYDDYIFLFDLKSLYSSLTNFKFSNKNAKKDGKSAYYITAKISVSELIDSTGEDSSSIFASVDASLSDLKDETATVKIYVNKKTGKLISLTIDMKSLYNKIMEKTSASIDAESGFQFSTKLSKANMTVKLNPEKYTKIKLPKNVVEDTNE